MTLGSIIIPAYNEQAIILRTLDTLLADAAPDLFEVIVACNGCTDDTAKIVRSSQHQVEVLECELAGKAAAIVEAERVATVLPRIYLDADVELTTQAACAILTELANGAIAARPPAKYLDGDSTFFVRHYWAARQRIPSLSAELCGAGVYGLSAVARSRFDEFPHVTGDDLFAARIVSADEVTIIDTDPVVVRIPRTVRNQLNVLRRVTRGNRQFAAAFPALAINTTAATRSGLISSCHTVREYFDFAVYASFAVAARLLVRLERKPVRWERDDSTRLVA